MEGMAKYPDKYFELAIVDPPYGLGIDGQKEDKTNKNPKHNRKGHDKKNWDKSIPTATYFDELFRVSQNQIIWGANYFVEHINMATKGWIVWYKGQQGLTMSDAELAFSSFDIPTRVATINRGELAKQFTFHPTEKPIKLYKWLLTNYAKPGDKILDTHIGSGSIRIACDQLGYSLTGYEIDKDYFAAQEQRFARHKAQLSLFS